MRLFRLELKRVLKTRSTIVLLLLSLALSVWMAWLPVSYVRLTVPTESGGEITLSGLQALDKRKQLDAPYTGEVTVEKLQSTLKQYQDAVAQYGDPNEEGFPREVFVEQIIPGYPLRQRLQEANQDVQTGMAPGQTELTQEDAARFYDQTQVHIADLMKLEDADHPDAQRQAKEMYSKVDQPFYYYSGYGTEAIEYIGFYLFLLVLFCTFIAATVFSAEYQTGADDILRCTKHGRIRLAVTKIGAALLIFIVTFAICMTIFTVISNSLFGWECRQTSLQIEASVASLPALTLGGMQNYVTAMGLLSLLATASFTLFVSSVCRSNVKALGLSLVFLLAPSICFMFGGGPFTQWLRCLMPSGAIGMTNSIVYTMMDFKFLHIGQSCFWPPMVMLISELAAIPLFLGLTVWCYQRHIAR